MKPVVAGIVLIALLALGAVAWVFFSAETAPPPRARRPARSSDDGASIGERERSSDAAPPAVEKRDAPTSPTASHSKGWIGGRVRDDQHRPVEGATVYAIAEDCYSVPKEQGATSDRDGRWRLPVRESGVTDLGAMKVGYVPVLLRDVSLDATASRDDVDFVLGAGAVISGHVRDPKGRALNGVRVACAPDDARNASPPTDGSVLPGRAFLPNFAVIAQTDPTGEYAVRGLEAGKAYAVSPTGGEFFAARQRGDDLSRRVPAPSSNVDFTMLASGVVLVTVVDDVTGSPVGGCSLELSGAGFGGRQVPEWWAEPIRFDKNLKAGRYKLSVDARCFEPAEQSFDLVDGAPPLELTVRLRRKSGVVAGSLRVTARDDLGAPVPSLCVHAAGVGVLADVAPAPNESIEPGVREVHNLEPGAYSVEVTSQSRDYESTMAGAEIRPGETTMVEVVLQGAGRLVVEVKNPEGEFLKGYRIDIRGEDGNRLSPEMLARAGSTMQSVTKGRVESPGPLAVGRLRPGRVTVAIACDGYEPRAETVDVRRGEEAPVPITLQHALR
ncbi:MAG: carboxypeptidase regulatory-like domain-containing protein [Planctomycetes bacterium]|nr:carboxypeptidase regulatory-like domain-containing protein [Planctomycetota bacterium]